MESGGQIIDSSNKYTTDDYSPDEEEGVNFDNAEKFGAPTTEF
jgi:hypothetical protein